MEKFLRHGWKNPKIAKKKSLYNSSLIHPLYKTGHDFITIKTIKVQFFVFMYWY